MANKRQMDSGLKPRWKLGRTKARASSMEDRMKGRAKVVSHFQIKVTTPFAPLVKGVPRCVPDYLYQL